MTLLHRAIHKPQRLLFRRVVFQVHLWTGIGLGLYIIVIAVSGAVIVFQDEMENALHPHLTHVPDGTGPQADFMTVVRSAQHAYPDYRLRSVFLPTENVQTFALELRKDDVDVDLIAYAHPVTAQMLGHRDRDGSVLGWINDLHHNLLAGETGRIVNGVGGLFLLLMCATGMVIWWPGVKGWKRALTVDARRTWKRVNWDLQRDGLLGAPVDRDVGAHRRVLRLAGSVPVGDQSRLSRVDDCQAGVEHRAQASARAARLV